MEHHVGEEETELFPKVAQSIDEEILEAIGADMEETQSELLDEGDPRDAIPDETDEAAPVLARHPRWWGCRLAAAPGQHHFYRRWRKAGAG